MVGALRRLMLLDRGDGLVLDVVVTTALALYVQPVNHSTSVKPLRDVTGSLLRLTHQMYIYSLVCISDI